jgi:hypothetical protein
MRRHSARHFRFAGNAVTTRIGVPVLTAPVFDFDRQRGAGNHLLGLVLGDLVPGDVRGVGVVPVKRRFRFSRHPSSLYTRCPYNAKPGRAPPSRAAATKNSIRWLSMPENTFSTASAVQIKRSAGTWKYSAGSRACALLMDCFPLSTSEATLVDPKTGITSRCRRPRCVLFSEA